jgi:hypothetical protein
MHLHFLTSAETLFSNLLLAVHLVPCYVRLNSS